MGEARKLRTSWGSPPPEPLPITEGGFRRRAALQFSAGVAKRNRAPQIVRDRVTSPSGESSLAQANLVIPGQLPTTNSSPAHDHGRRLRPSAVARLRASTTVGSSSGASGLLFDESGSYGSPRIWPIRRRSCRRHRTPTITANRTDTTRTTITIEAAVGTCCREVGISWTLRSAPVGSQRDAAFRGHLRT